MLLGLSIRDIVLIDKLDLTFKDGLCTLTGETGAGKSILLDALGLALGARADTGLIRQAREQGSVTAEFELAAGDAVETLLAERGVEAEGTLVLRRVVGADGRSRAFVNDQPVSVGLLREVGQLLVEIHGQGEEYGLFSAVRQRRLLDAFGGLQATADDVAKAYGKMDEAARAAAEAKAALESARREEDYIRHALAEMDELDPKVGEEGALAEERRYLMQAEKVAAALNEAAGAFAEGGGVENGLRGALHAVERVAAAAGGRLDRVVEVLERALAEAGEAAGAIEAAARELELEPTRLEEIEERLFALRALARKHQTEVDGLVETRARLTSQAAMIDDGADKLARLEDAAAAALASYRRAADRLTKERRKAATRLNRAVAAELGPLRLGDAEFRAEVEPAPNGAASVDGVDRVAFLVRTNKNAAPAPIGKIASGGELSRFMLAVKVALAEAGGAKTLIFDEVDRGIGGATADAVGERLARLAKSLQVLVVTHSPQVAARGHHHWRAAKRDNGEVVTTVEYLDEQARGEEIARMLAGAEVTNEARAAARSLLQG